MDNSVITEQVDWNYQLTDVEKHNGSKLVCYDENWNKIPCPPHDPNHYIVTYELP